MRPDGKEQPTASACGLVQRSPSTSNDTSGKAVGSAGLFLLVLALVSNEYVLAYCFSPDGVIEGFNRALIRLFECVVAAVGLLLVGFRRRIPVLALLVIPLTVIVGLGVVEVLLGVIELKPPALARANPNGTGSYRLRPNLDFTYAYGGKRVRITTNSHGMRWREVPLSKPPGKKRIAFVGDSFIFGESADSLEESAAGVFESEIDQSKYEVLNFGMVGYGFSDIRLQLEEQVFAFEPDYVILVSFNGNDFRDTYLGLNQYDVSTGIIERDWDTLMAKVPAAYRPVQTPKTTADAYSVFGRLRLVRVLQRARTRMQADAAEGQAAKPREDRGCSKKTFTMTTEFTSFPFWSASVYPKVASEAKDVSLRELTRIHAICEWRGVKLLVVALPFEEQVYANALAGIDANGIPYNMALPQQYVERWARKKGVPCLDLLPILRNRALEQNLCLYPNGLDMHLNTTGHGIMGRAIVEFFRCVAEDESDETEANRPGMHGKGVISDD